MTFILHNAKAITAFISGFILLGLEPIGVTPATPTGETIELVVNSLVVAFAVWVIPNAKD